MCAWRASHGSCRTGHLPSFGRPSCAVLAASLPDAALLHRQPGTPVCLEPLRHARGDASGEASSPCLAHRCGLVPSHCPGTTAPSTAREGCPLSRLLRKLGQPAGRLSCTGEFTSPPGLPQTRSNPPLPPGCRQIYESGPRPQPSNASLAVDPTPGSAAVAGDEADEPPAVCTTPCQDDGGGLLTCRTSSGQVVVCPGSSLAPGAEAAGGGGMAAALPAPDCVTDCQAVQGYPICFTADSQPRACQPAPAPTPAAAPLTAQTAAAPVTAAPVPAPEQAAAPTPGPTGSTALGAAQLDGHPLCSAAPLKVNNPGKNVRPCAN